MSELFEALMIISFGISWPISISKSIKSKTAKGKSLFFLVLILLGYICGITGKLVSRNITYVFIFYVINFICVTIDLCLYFHNAKLDRHHI